MAPIAVTGAGDEVVDANLGQLVRRLLLFEEVVIDSYGMRELPYLIRALGSKSFVDLLESGAVRIRVSGWTMGEIGGGGLIPGRGGAPLPYLQYAFSSVTAADQEAHVALCLAEIRNMGLSIKTSKRVRKSIVKSLVHTPEDAGVKTVEALPRDFTRNEPLVRSALALALSATIGHGISDEDEFEVSVDRVDEHVYAATSDISSRYGLTDEQADATLQAALLTIAGLNQRVEEMEAYGTLVGFRDTEISLLREKLSFLVWQLASPEAQERRFGRVVSLAGLPDPTTSGSQVDVGKLLRARDSTELREFRRWLRTLDDVSDDELEERLRGVRAIASEAVHSGSGRVIRFLASNAVSFVPVVGPLAGIAVGAVDEFLLDRILPESGPLSFIGGSYPSIVKAPPT